MSDRDPLLAILRGLHDALAQLADTTHWAAERARESLAEVDRLLREQEQADRMLRLPCHKCKRTFLTLEVWGDHIQTCDGT